MAHLITYIGIDWCGGEKIIWRVVVSHSACHLCQGMIVALGSEDNGDAAGVWAGLRQPLQGEENMWSPNYTWWNISGNMEPCVCEHNTCWKEWSSLEFKVSKDKNLDKTIIPCPQCLLVWMTPGGALLWVTVSPFIFKSFLSIIGRNTCLLLERCARRGQIITFVHAFS